MAYTVDVYKGVNKLGSGSMSNGVNTITSYSANAGRTVGSGRNVQVTETGGNNIGATQCMQVLTDGGATLTMNHTGKFS